MLVSLDTAWVKDPIFAPWLLMMSIASFFPCDLCAAQCARVLIAQSLDPITFPQLPRLPANLAGMEGLLYGGFDALADGVIRVVHMDTQPAKFLLHLQHFELVSACPLHFRDRWFQVLA